MPTSEVKLPAGVVVPAHEENIETVYFAPVITGVGVGVVVGEVGVVVGEGVGVVVGAKTVTDAVPDCEFPKLSTTYTEIA